MNTSFNAANQTATLKLPSSVPGAGPRLISCLFQGFSGQILSLECSEKPEALVPVSVEYNDAMFLGEIVALASHAEGHWQAQIMVEQVLTGLQSLLTLRNHLVGEGAGPSVSREETCQPVAVSRFKPREFCLGY